MLLAGCSHAPDDEEMRSAMGRQLKGTGADVKSLRKIGCKDEGSSGYRCDVEVEMVTFGINTKMVRSLRFIKASDGWAVSL